MKKMEKPMITLLTFDGEDIITSSTVPNPNAVMLGDLSQVTKDGAPADDKNYSGFTMNSGN